MGSVCLHGGAMLPFLPHVWDTMNWKIHKHIKETQLKAECLIPPRGVPTGHPQPAGNLAPSRNRAVV